MKTTNELDDAVEDITESATGEYPVIKEGEPPPAPQLNGTHLSAQGDGEKAAFWLTHLENEVSRLHTKWHSIDAEFKVREACIADLREEVKGRDATLAELTENLRGSADALRAADERVASKESEIAGLITDAKDRDRKIAELATAIGAAEERHRELQETLNATRTEVARLDASVRREQEASAGVAKLNEDLLAEQRGLQGKIQDFETYINGRHQSWSELNAQLASHKDALVGLERTVKARDAAVARFDDEKRQLAARILDLERQGVELVGRRKEREVAYDELQRKLAEHFEATEQLKAEHASRTKETEQALAKAAEREKLLESLERGVTQRDDSLLALGAELEKHRTSVADLSGAKEHLSKRVDDLDKTLAERTLQAQTLRAELRTSNDQLETLRHQLGERDMQLAASRDAAAEKGRVADGLADSLRTLQQETAEVRADLARLEAHAAELGRLRGESLAEGDRLKVELAAQHELVSSLETRLRAKQATEDLLERNVGRITDLGASLAALDRRMEGEEPSRADIHFPDFIETLASDAAGDLDASRERAPLGAPKGADAGAGARVVRRAEPVRKTTVPRKLVVMLDGDGVDYPLVKKETTIGRGHGSDIRIASHFISRIHAKVSTNGIATVIEDAGSKNGILVNSERVQRRVLRDGDVVSLGGELNLRFVDAAP